MLGEDAEEDGEREERKQGSDAEGEGGTSSGRHAQTYDTRVQSKIHSHANLAAARATCRLAAARCGGATLARDIC